MANLSKQIEAEKENIERFFSKIQALVGPKNTND